MNECWLSPRLATGVALRNSSEIKSFFFWSSNSKTSPLEALHCVPSLSQKNRKKLSSSCPRFPLTQVSLTQAGTHIAHLFISQTVNFFHSPHFLLTVHSFLWLPLNKELNHSLKIHRLRLLSASSCVSIYTFVFIFWWSYLLWTFKYNGDLFFTHLRYKPGEMFVSHVIRNRFNYSRDWI